jgi:hypothetical protein
MLAPPPGCEIFRAADWTNVQYPSRTRSPTLSADYFGASLAYGSLCRDHD